MPILSSLPLSRCLLLSTFAVALAVSAPAQSNFGSVNIGADAAATATLTLSNAATIGGISVRTQGSENLDFTDAGSGTCVVGKAYTANATCTVNLLFTPMRVGT